MAQRSATARNKLDKITNANSEQAGNQNSPRNARKQISSVYGAARLGSGGLLTPSASSVSGSSRNSLQLQQPQRVGKGSLRAFLEGKGEKLRRGFVHGHKREASDTAQPFYTGLGGGVGTGSGLGGMSTIGEERLGARKWEGGGSRGEEWDGGGKGKKDLELWFPDGDTLIYLADKPLPQRNSQGILKVQPPQPSFRLPSSVLRQVGSPYLDSLLEESSRESAILADAPATPQSSQPSTEAMEIEYNLRRSQTMETLNSIPSTINSQATHESVEGGIIYRLYFPVPGRLDRIMRQRYHLTTRNFFAVLFNKPLVGVTLGQTLIDLVDRTDDYLSEEPVVPYGTSAGGIAEDDYPYGSFLGTVAPVEKKSHPSTYRMILNYLETREFDDVRSWTEGAAGLLVWTEKAGQIARDIVSSSDMHRIEALWREGFVHCTGQLSSLQITLEWRDISPITKALIDRASLEIQVRVSKADSRLTQFDFGDMWPMSPANPPPARLAYEKFQKFLMKHYASRFGSWPSHETRFTRSMYLHLQRDFGALYDYLVDRSAAWSNRRIVNPIQLHFRADDDQLQITDMLLRFDDAEGHPHIPHPFPLIPTNSQQLGYRSSAAPGSPPVGKRQQRFFTSSTPHTKRPTPAAALALSEATNIGTLYATKTINPLVEAFSNHEKTYSENTAPSDARKGRWVLIYGVLQTLATVAPDAPGIKWTEGVDYFLNPKLRGTPPWGEQPVGPDERSHWRSHCWIQQKGKGVEVDMTEAGDSDEADDGDDEGSPEPELAELRG